MERTPHTHTGSRRAIMHFSGNLPSFVIGQAAAGVAAEYAEALPNVAVPEPDPRPLGRHLLELETRVGSRDERDEAAKRAPAPGQEPAAEPATGRSDTDPASQPADPRVFDTRWRPSKPVNMEEIDIEPDEALSPANQRYERMILYLLHCPNQTLERIDAGKFLRKELGIAPGSEWASTRSRLERLAIIESYKMDPQSHRTDRISLNVDALRQEIGQRFVTPRVLALLQSEAGSPPDEGNSGQPSTEAPVASSSSSPSPQPAPRPATAPPELSARVRRAKEREPEPQPGYRNDGPRPRHREGRPFLESRRSERGHAPRP